MDPWARFDQALLSRGDTADAVRQVLHEVDSTMLGSAADKAELRACATCVLARLGQAEMSAAVAAVGVASAEGRSAWPHLYLAEAAMARSDPALALDALRRVPRGYFDDLDLHWREVQVLLIEAEALFRTGERDAGVEVLRKLNGEYANESDDEFLPAPTALIEVLLAEPQNRTALTALLDRVELDGLMPALQREKVAVALAEV